jgi:hypothetical protein
MLAIAFNAAMLVIAIVWAIRARRHLAALNRRRHALDAQESR